MKQTVAYSVPHEVGFTAKHNWTLELIATYVEREWGHCYSLRGISKVMQRLGHQLYETDLHARSSEFC
ncbi:winged helix-turn-helix domain-containing protein [Paenibacillus larvae]|nr:winged helix-turn-helix domain-containing protein [Paenibacillus larvae]MDT2236252.1 winged helix-turn-helix domain-containing protein [Paenibacillus larvae]